MYWAPIHFGTLCKNTYNITTCPRQNGHGRQNVRLYVYRDRGATAKMFQFSFAVITYASPIFSFSLFFFFPFFLFFLFLFFLFSLFCRPLKSAARGESPPLPPPSVRHCRQIPITHRNNLVDESQLNALHSTFRPCCI